MCLNQPNGILTNIPQETKAKAFATYHPVSQLRLPRKHTMAETDYFKPTPGGVPLP